MKMPDQTATSSIDSPEIEFIRIDDKRLQDFAVGDLDLPAIMDWVNSQIPHIRRNRLQFLTVLPALVPTLVFDPDGAFAEDIIIFIDEGTPLVEAVADIFDVSNHSVRFLLHKPWSLVSGRQMRNELQLMTALELLPPDKRPQTKEEWEIMWALASAVNLFHSGASGHIFRDLCVRGYMPGMALAEQLTNDDISKFIHLHDYFDFVNQWVAGLVSQRVVDEMRTDDVATLFLARYSVTSIWNQSLIWHQLIVNLEKSKDAREKLALLDQWPVLFPNPIHVNDLHVVSVTTIDEIEAEGRELEHCVGTYVNKCILGESHIVSVRDKQGKRLSTAEIELVEEYDGTIIPMLVQHQGLSNQQPVPEAQHALDEGLRWLLHPDRQDLIKSLAHFHANRKAKIESDLEGIRTYDHDTVCALMSQVLHNYSACVETVGLLMENISANSDRSSKLLGSVLLPPSLPKVQ